MYYSMLQFFMFILSTHYSITELCLKYLMKYFHHHSYLQCIKWKKTFSRNLGISCHISVSQRSYYFRVITVKPYYYLNSLEGEETLGYSFEYSPCLLLVKVIVLWYLFQSSMKWTCPWTSPNGHYSKTTSSHCQNYFLYIPERVGQLVNLFVGWSCGK